MQAAEIVTTISSAAGELRITRAAIADYDTVMCILREAADCLTSRGNPQWEGWYLEVGERMLRERLVHHEVYLARRDAVPIGTVTIQWSDPEQWGERGLDDRAGYIHDIAIMRTVGGMRVGERCSNGRSIWSLHEAGVTRVWTAWQATWRSAAATMIAASLRLERRCLRETGLCACSNAR